MIPTSVIIAGIKFDHLVKVVFTKFLHCNVTTFIFPFIIKKYFCGEIL